MEFNKNMGGTDRAIRVAAGIFLISLAFLGPQTAWGWIGLIPLATAVIGFCPAYQMIGMNTCNKN